VPALPARPGRGSHGDAQDACLRHRAEPRVRGTQKPTDRQRHAQLEEQGESPAVITCHERAVAEHEPPALGARVFRHAAEQRTRLLVVEGQQRELPAAVDPGDDTRRPPAELSPTRVEQDRPLWSR
jgi:hypothetical protein